MRTIPFALVTLAAAFAFAAPASGAPAHGLTVDAERWRTHIRFQADWTLYVPKSCLAFYENEFARPILCGLYFTGDGRITLRVVHRAKLIYRESYQVRGDGPRNVGFVQGPLNPAIYVGSARWRGRLYFSALAREIGRCSPGRYEWSATVTDGVRAALNTTRRGSFVLACPL